MAYSSGFNPHPRISYAGASPTGAASEAEYLEIGLAERVDPARLADDLDRAAARRARRPRGRRGQPRQPGRPARGQPVARSTCPVPPATVDAGGRGLPRLRVGDRRADDEEGDARLRQPRGRARAATSRRTTRGRGSTVVLRHTVPAVRPDDVLTGLRQVGGLEDARSAAGHAARSRVRTTRRPVRSATRYPVDSAGIGGPVCDTRGDRKCGLPLRLIRRRSRRSHLRRWSGTLSPGRHPTATRLAASVTARQLHEARRPRSVTAPGRL